MMTYYGVWSESGQTWWQDAGQLFYVQSLRLARAQAMVSNTVYNKMLRTETLWGWEARAIGEKGLPKIAINLTEEQKRIRSELASHRCMWCGDTATNWAEVSGQKQYSCDKHECWGQDSLRNHVFYAARHKSKPEAHQCAICGEPATEWVNVRIKGWMCEQHKVVKVGGLSEEEVDPDDAFSGV